MIPQRIAYFPAAIFGMIMGMTGLGIAWLKGLEQAQTPMMLQAYFVAVAALMAFFFLLYSFKAFKHLDEVKKDMKHPIKMNFIPAMSISLLLMSIVAWETNLQTLSFYLWSIGASAHFVLTYWVLYNWVHHDFFRIEHSNPAWFIPIVGNIIVPLVGVHHVHLDINVLFFATGMMFWLFLKAILLNRIIFHEPLPQRLIPTLVIFIAPPAVGFLSYLAINGGQLDIFAKVLFFFGLVMTFLMIASLGKFLKLQFALSSWAFTFPIAAMAIACFKYQHLSGLDLIGMLGWVMTIALSVMVVLFTIKTFKAAKNKQICVDH